MHAISDKDNGFAVFDKIDALRTDYLRELTALAKIFITISTAMLGLTLAPLAPNLFMKVGAQWLVMTWAALVATALLGFIQVFFFSSRFKARADYLWTSQLTDLLARIQGSDKKLDEFLQKSDRYRRRYDRQHTLCVILLLSQGIALLTAFSFLAIFMWTNFKARGLS
jgi:hypothetical protein